MNTPRTHLIFYLVIAPVSIFLLFGGYVLSTEENQSKEKIAERLSKASLAKRMRQYFPSLANAESLDGESFSYFVIDEKLNLIKNTVIIREASGAWTAFDCGTLPTPPGYLNSIKVEWRAVEPFNIKALQKYFAEPNAKIGNSTELPSMIETPIVYVEHRIKEKRHGYILDDLNLIRNEKEAGLIGKIAATMSP